MADDTLTPSQVALLQQLYDNLFTPWGVVQGEDLIAMRGKGYAFLYGPADLHYYAGFFEPAGPHIEDQPVSITEAGANAIGRPWPIEQAHRDQVWAGQFTQQ